MFVNYFKIAFRNLLKHRAFSFINIVGLSLGMTCSILILLWVRDELSFDRFHDNADTLYRVEEDQHYTGEVFHVNVTPHPLAPELTVKIPEILEATRYSWDFGMLIRYQDKAFFETRIRAVDPAFLSMFSFPFVHGDESTALSDPLSIVISEETAKKYFGEEDPIGKVLSGNNKFDLIVKGVIRNVPSNSILQFDILVPYDFMRIQMGWGNDHWGSNSLQTFVRIREGSLTGPMDEKITALVKSHYEESTTDFMLAPLTRIHLHGYSGYRKSIGNVQYVYIFSMVALFVLLLACINFMNLSTARSANRAREIGVRKVAGASQSSIAWQFVGESALFALLALFVALLLVIQLLPYFNDLSGKEISPGVLSSPAVLAGLVGLTLVTGLLAGSYPALFLSGFRPAVVLKGSVAGGARSSGLRKVLVVAQFALSIFLIIGTGVVYSQLEYMRNKSLGYDKEHLLYVEMRGDMQEFYEPLKSGLLSLPEVLGVTASQQRPAMIGWNSSGAEWEGKDPELKFLISHDRVDYGYIETLGIQMAAGRSFSREFASDAGTDSTGVFVINQTLAKMMGIDPVVGAFFSFQGKKGNIIGIMEDFHYHSLRNAIEPLALLLAGPEELRNVTIRLRPGSLSENVESLRSLWDRVMTGYPFEFQFVDQELEGQYRAEERMVGVLRTFAVLAVVISCLGLFGLASFMAEQRTKEIGIRKVLGATVSNIVFLLSREFSKWVVIASLIAWPVAFLVMNNWLQKFIYRIELSWPTFLLSGALALVVALLTVSWQAIKSAITDPAKALRYE